MYLKFNKIEIEGFQSIGKASVSLSDNGIVAVKGINNYENNTNSNGSGKSSLFESILWCIYGKTSKSVSKVTNKNYPDGCRVTLSFNVNEDEYELTRSQNHKKLKSTTVLIQNGSDISGRNRSDTDNILINDVLKEFTPEIFQSIIFLSQGFNSRFGILTPSKRKERLENISQISEKVEKFKHELESMEKAYNQEYLNYSNQVSTKCGEKGYIERDIFSIQSSIDEYEKNLKELDNTIDIEKLREELLKLQLKQSDIFNKIAESNKMLRRKESNVQSLKAHLTSLEADGNRYRELLKHTQTYLCPTCKQKINNSIAENLTKEYNNKLSELRVKYIEVSKKLTEEEISYAKLESETDNLREKNLSINADIKNKNQLILKNSIELKDIDKDKNRIVELKAKIPDLEKEINSIQVKMNEIQTSIQVVQHCKQLVSKQFRNFLLQDVIDFINKRLEYYSKYLYSNSTDIIKVISDSSKLDIMVGDTLYESLSGGEARKVDLALALAQRDLSLNISCSSSNIMILDEIMDNLDEHSSACAFDMILKSIDDLSSVYIISHNNYAIPYDSVLTVIKEKDKISHIKFSE